MDDLIAERLVQLGGTAEGTVTVVAERTNLDEFPLNIVDGRDHVERRIDRLASSASSCAGTSIRRRIGDKGTSNLLIDVVRDVDKL